jgi:hypothetical protein
MLHREETASAFCCPMARELQLGRARPYSRGAATQWRHSPRSRFACAGSPVTSDGYTACLTMERTDSGGEAVLAVYARGEFDVLLPTHEQVAVLSCEADRLREAKVAIAVPSFVALIRVRDKLSAFATMTDLGLPQPAARQITTAERWRGGTASRLPQITDRNRHQRGPSDRCGSRTTAEPVAAAARAAAGARPPRARRPGG